MTSDRFILPAACVASITMNCPFDQCGWTDSLSALFNPHIRITCMGSGFEISWGESTIADSWEGIVRPFAQMQRARQRSLFVFLVHNSHSGSSGKSGNIGRVVGHQSVSIDFSKPYRSGYKVLLLVLVSTDVSSVGWSAILHKSVKANGFGSCIYRFFQSFVPGKSEQDLESWLKD